MNCALDALAQKFPSTKFVKIISTECVEDYEDHLLPTLLVYNNDTLSVSLCGLCCHSAAHLRASTHSPAAHMLPKLAPERKFERG
jgi:hypothetical protein